MFYTCCGTCQNKWELGTASTCTCRPVVDYDRAIELLYRCENEMRYAGWWKYEADNTERNGVYEQVKQFLEKNT